MMINHFRIYVEKEDKSSGPSLLVSCLPCLHHSPQSKSRVADVQYLFAFPPVNVQYLFANVQYLFANYIYVQYLLAKVQYLFANVQYLFANVQYLFASPPVKSNQINRRCGYQGYWGTRIGCRNKIPTCLKAIGLQGVAHKFYL